MLRGDVVVFIKTFFKKTGLPEVANNCSYILDQLVGGIDYVQAKPGFYSPLRRGLGSFFIKCCSSIVKPIRLFVRFFPPA